ncbi:hypothetical protein NEDG_00697 [Nematocida displodere]|uniref:Uncharacterized protein n=1 Tax=Nematocida displodere TaxID=1805483 RepID=A0A177EC87_9MICR|nr:hypothetical protein NEDG_00697 [Nematocida displodere]
MKVLERIALVLSATAKERERITASMERYNAEKVSEKQRSHLLVVSSLIEESSREEDLPFEQLTIPEKRDAIILLNKRLSQINNTQEKVSHITRLVLQYASTAIPPQKLVSFSYVTIDRLIEQIQAQVSANKASATGYALFLTALSAQTNIIHLYKKVLFKSVLPLECLLGMYRVYFAVLRESGQHKEAWQFVSSLLNHTKKLETTFNPCVLQVFLEVLGPFMLHHYQNHWKGLLSCISTDYLPLVTSRFPTEACCIKGLLEQFGG